MYPRSVAMVCLCIAVALHFLGTAEVEFYLITLSNLGVRAPVELQFVLRLCTFVEIRRNSTTDPHASL